MVKFPRRLFVTATDTNVGKTLVSSILCSGLDCSYWKPVQCGTSDGTDSATVKHLAQMPEAKMHAERYVLPLPMSPHAAAEAENIEIQLSDFTIPEHNHEHLIIEGAGGLLVPLNRRHLVADLIKALDVPVLLVARSTLGTINHTLLTISELRRRNIELFGIVLTGPRNQSNKDAIEHFTQTEVIAEIDHIETIDPPAVLQAFYKNFGSSHDSHNNTSRLSDLASVYTNENGTATAESKVGSRR